MKSRLKNALYFLSGFLVAFSINAIASSGKFSDVNENDYFFSSVDDVSSEGIMNGYPDGTFRPGISLKRGEAAVSFSLLKKRLNEKMSELGGEVFKLEEKVKKLEEKLNKDATAPEEKIPEEKKEKDTPPVKENKDEKEPAPATENENKRIYKSENLKVEFAYTTEDEGFHLSQVFTKEEANKIEFYIKGDDIYKDKPYLSLEIFEKEKNEDLKNALERIFLANKPNCEAFITVKTDEEVMARIIPKEADPESDCTEYEDNLKDTLSIFIFTKDYPHNRFLFKSYKPEGKIRIESFNFFDTEKNKIPDTEGKEGPGLPPSTESDGISLDNIDKSSNQDRGGMKDFNTAKIIEVDLKKEKPLMSGFQIFTDKTKGFSVQVPKAFFWSVYGTKKKNDGYLWSVAFSKENFADLSDEEAEKQISVLISIVSNDTSLERSSEMQIYARRNNKEDYLIEGKLENKDLLEKIAKSLQEK